MKNTLREALLARRVSLGAWIQVGHPAGAEVLARAGFDWACVDLEHGVIGIETMADVFRALEAGGCEPVARVPTNDPVWIHRCLDAGARGLIVPMVNTAQQAAAAVREAKFPPQGARGFGYARANAYGADFAAYAETANDEVAVIVQIEHREAIANLDAILSVDGVDAAFIGPYDLSGSLGVVGQLNHPEVIAAQDRFLGACSAHGVAAGLHVVEPDDENVPAALARGYTLIALGLDVVFLREGAVRAVRAAREQQRESTTPEEDR